MTSTVWPGILDADALNPKDVDDSNQVADAARAGNWPAVLERLHAVEPPSVNRWRIGGRSWFTPLHQAAWLGAPTAVAEQLLRLGAWRSLRSADGDRAIDLAERRGHHHLADALAIRDPGEREQQRFVAWDWHLAELISERTRHLDPVHVRPVPTEIIAMEELDTLWFAYPGMYGGFSMSAHRNRLVVESWSHVAGAPAKRTSSPRTRVCSWRKASSDRRSPVLTARSDDVTHPTATLTPWPAPSARPPRCGSTGSRAARDRTPSRTP